LRSLQRFRTAFVGLSLVVAASGVSFGSGFGLFEQGAKATAMGGAFAATADDPSAIFYNVAGIAQQRQFTFMAGGTGINFANQFTGDPNDPFTSGASERYRAHTFIPPNAYLLMPIGSNITFGVGLFSPFGLRTNWENPNRFIGRFISQDANLKALDVEPALAWQTSDGRFALGVGADYRRMHIILARNSAALNPFNQRISDVANARLNSDWDSAWGYNAGLLFKPTPTWSIGASYRSNIDIDFKGDAQFTQILTGFPQFDAAAKAQIPPDQGISTTISMPAITSLGIATTAISGWQLEADTTYTTWSRFKNLDVAFDLTPQVNINRPQNWHNSWSYRVGGNRHVTDTWDIRLGALYDKSPQPTSGVGPLLPDANRVGPSFGIGYHGDHVTFDVTEFYLHFLPRSSQGTNVDGFNGSYKTDANLVSLNLGYKF
jgi:long-chain fatty acid transport protein